jgi:glutaredoxin
MKKILLIAVLLLAWQQWDRIEAFFNPPEDLAAYQKEEVVLFATAWCGYCEKTRKFFHASNITFREVDIEKSIEGRKQYEALGGRGVPLIVAGGKLIRGYDPRAIEAALKDAR